MTLLIEIEKAEGLTGDPDCRRHLARAADLARASAHRIDALEAALKNAVDKLAGWDDDRDRDGVAYQSQALADLVSALRAEIKKGAKP